MIIQWDADNISFLWVLSTRRDENISKFNQIFSPHSQPIKQRDCPGAGLMLVQRHRRWPNIKTAMGQRILFTCWVVMSDENTSWSTFWNVIAYTVLYCGI